MYRKQFQQKRKQRLHLKFLPYVRHHFAQVLHSDQSRAGCQRVEVGKEVLDKTCPKKPVSSAVVQRRTGKVESHFLVSLHVCTRKNISSRLLILSESSPFDVLIYFNPGRAEHKVSIRKDFLSKRPL